MREKKMIGSSLLLFLTACIWGVAFVAQSVGMDYMEPLTFNGARFLLGGTVLLPMVFSRAAKRIKKNEGIPAYLTIKGGICCGLAICAASLFQQYGIQRTTVGKAGFITTLYIIIVPVLGLFLHKKVPGRVWIAAAIAGAGLYLLCINESFSIGRGDTLVFICAVLFSIHILVIDYFSPKTDGVLLSCIQFYVAGSICTAGAFFFEQPSLEGLAAGAVPLLYAGILSCGVAYTLQIVGQKRLEPTVASLILSVESVVSVLAGWAILGQALSARELLGCVLVFAAVILAQVPARRRS
ncbi:MAG: DMT family transporter [Lachnospiraceae bacterium]|nr:DMT family transporter [Lachnospiraceae bacterium]